MGNQSAATTLWEESLTLLQKPLYSESLRLCLQQWGCQVAQQGESVWAARLWGAAEALDETSSRRSPFFLLRVKRLDAEQATYEQQISAIRTHLGEQAFATAWEEGRRMTPEQALAAQGHPLISDQPPAHANPKASAKVHITAATVRGSALRSAYALPLAKRTLRPGPPLARSSALPMTRE